MAFGTWIVHAACRGKTQIFYPRRGDTDTMRQAKAICATCPVLDNCRNHILDVAERYGIWAGMTEPERRNFRRVNRKAATGLDRHGSRSCYVRGCRCTICRTANANYRQQRRLSGAP